MRILGIHDGHNASVCLLENGEIRWVIQEERISREKNYDGFPHKSLSLLLEKSALSPADIDRVSLNGQHQPKPMNRMQRLNAFKNLSSGLVSFKSKLKRIKTVNDLYADLNNQQRIKPLLALGFKESQITFIDHHQTHASAAYFALGDRKEEVLVFTNDGAGDRICATVSIGRNGQLQRLGEVSEQHSIGLLYAMFTFLTGMVPLEHEYKIMGMAPYADQVACQKVANEFHAMFDWSEHDLGWRFIKGESIYQSLQYFKDFMFLKRFDHLMGGLQLFTEQFLTRWVSAWIKHTGISRIALSGGTFMNVKANKCLAELDEVSDIFVFPSCGDESNAIGAAYASYQAFRVTEQSNLPAIAPLFDLYFGVEFDDQSILNAFNACRFKSFFKSSYRIEKMDHINHSVAKLLADGQVVARFSGREEFGARSLGNRAILANPQGTEVIKTINEMIKNRDFWMPFACSILAEDFDRYVVDHNKNQPYYMIMTYDTKPDAEQILAGIHPYDKTVRPQRVEQKHNPAYWDLINQFKALTGVGGLLNTSLNLHGLPLVHKPEDAFEVLEHSQLQYLAIGDYLISKIS